jgi:hypothetical protein
MTKTFTDLDLDELFSALSKVENSTSKIQNSNSRNPVHVVYGGADRFSAETPEKLGKLALKSLEDYAPNFVEFARALWLTGADSLPEYVDAIQDLEFSLADDPEKVKTENYDAWVSWTIHQKVFDKLKREPVEDFRIDFEDGYGIRTDVEEDSHCISASNELALLFRSEESESGRKEKPNEKNSPSPDLPISFSTLAFCGFRIKSFQPETRKRAVRTLDLFLTNLLENTEGKLPENFVVTLPKVKYAEETAILDQLLTEFEKQNNLTNGEIKVEILIETPESIFNMQDLVSASNGRCVAAHFGAFDYTSSFGITALHQHLRHDACNFARNMMQVSLSPLGIRLADSVTTEIPIPIHRSDNLSIQQIAENKLAVKNAWRKHFNNITHSMINGFYQSWDLHPAQLVARYAAVYAFFLESKDSQIKRLRGFLDKATQAMTTGNLFDDLASAEGLLNFLLRGINCGAFEKAEILKQTGLSDQELGSASFARIMKNRFAKQKFL